MRALGLLLAIALVGVILVLVVSAESIDNANDDSEKKVIKSTIITFEGISETLSDIPEKSVLNIPKNIEKYDLLTFDIQKMRDALTCGRQIPVCIEGVSYTMNLSEIVVNAPDVESQAHSYVGSLENTKNSEIVLTISERVLIARITIDNIDYVIESTPGKSQSGKIVHYVHSSNDVNEEGEYLFGVEDYLAHKEYSSDELQKREKEARIAEEGMAVKSEVAVRIRIFPDSQWISDEPDWQTKAQAIIAEVNNQFQRSDLQVRFYAHYDASKASALSGDSKHISPV